MTNANDFAYSIEYETRFGSEDQFVTKVAEGLSKREYFAVMAMQGYISAGCNGMPDAKRIVELALETADALIKALNK